MCIPEYWSSVMYCKFPAVCSNVLDVISILVSEIMVMYMYLLIYLLTCNGTPHTKQRVSIVFHNVHGKICAFSSVNP